MTASVPASLPLLVFLPGLASDHRVWTAQRQAMQQARPALPLAVSDALTRADSIEAMASVLLADYPASDLVLCGASMGAMVAMEAARQAPQRVRGLALLGSSARPETAEIRAVREAAMVLFRDGRAREVLDANVPLAFHAAAATRPELVATYLEMVLQAGVPLLLRQNQAVIARPDARLHLPQLRCPALVLCGLSDQLTPPDCAREIAQLIPQADLQLLPECGHMLTMEQPDAVNQQLLRWLDTRVLT